MVWRGPRTTKDQTYSNKAWAKVKQYWINQHHPDCRAAICLMPGIPIDYAPPYTQPASFNCGHIVPKWRAKAMGWTLDQMNSVENSRPEHRRCNSTDGARIGQQRQRARTRVTTLGW